MVDAAAGSPWINSDRPRRWWVPRVSLRVLMVLVLVVGGWLGWQARRASIQRRVVAAIKAAGGMILFDYQAQPGKPWQIGAAPWAPRWLRAWVGDEYFQEIAVVFISNQKGKPDRVTPATLEAVCACPKLYYLQSIRVQWPEPALAALTRQTELRELTVLDSRLTEAGLQHLHALPNLTNLALRVRAGELAGSCLRALEGLNGLTKLEFLGLDPVEPADLAPIRAMKQLDSLRIVLSPQAGSSLEVVRGFEQLKILDLRQTRATDADLKVLTTLPRLEHLLIDASALTDAGLATLAQVPTLDTLYLFHDPLDPTGRITDAGLTHLSRLPRLQTLSIDGGNLTARGWTQLQGLPIQNLELTGIQPGEADLLRTALQRPLASLVLSGPGVTDDCLDLLQNQSGLTQLTLNDTAITDAGIDALIRHLPAVGYLGLDSTTLTDAGLLKFAGAPATLRSISALGTRVTPSGIAALRTVNAGIKIEIGPIVPFPRHRTSPQPVKPVKPAAAPPR